MLNLFKHELFSRRMMILIWGIGLTLWGSLYIYIFPEIKDQMGMFAEMEIMKAFGMDDVSTMEGWVASIVIQVMPIVLGVYTIILATGTLAGEEESGTLELVVAMPLKRWQVVTMKTLALLLVLFLIMVIFSIGSGIVFSLVVSTADLALEVTPWQFFIGLLASYPLQVALFGISLFLGAFMPSRRLTLVVMYVFYLVSYVLRSAGSMAESVAWMKQISLLHYVNTTSSVFTDGPAASDIFTLVAIGVIGFGLALWSFQGRNITVGQWMWQRKQLPAG